MTGGDDTREVANLAIRIGEDSTRLWSTPGSEAAVVEGFPQWLDAYRRDRRLGHGGMGLVYRYRDTKLDRLVAVKTMPPAMAGDPKWRKRFSGEAKALAALDHHNIAKIHHVIEYQGSDFLILEYVPGVTLTEELARGALPLERALSIGLQVGRAIEAGHGLNIIHRDIKPGNIMVTSADVAKLLDYGLARRDPPSRSSPSGSTDTTMVESTEDGRVQGTPGYMSPEQSSGAGVDERTDIWAFGCVLFECLTGRPAFPGATKHGRLAATMEREPDWTALPPQTPPAVRRTLEHCLHKEPEQRLQHIGDACVELARALEDPREKPRGPVPHNLPIQITSFVSRESEIERLKQLLSRARLLTLTGPGGSGKTRLAQELARALVHETAADGAPLYPEGVWLVELASLSGADLLPEAVASVLKISQPAKPRPDQTLLQLLVERLTTRTVLLVLDNCEHLVSGCALLAADLLRHCPHLQVIATSRQSLGITGEQTYQVPELSFPGDAPQDDVSRYESVRLFVARAALARSGFTLTQGNAASVAGICRRLEGIPFALELAAARVRSLPVEELADRLFEVLDPARVLESSIEGSVGVLAPAERALLGRLSVFRGGWTLEAAEAVCADRGGKPIRRAHVVRRLSQLVEKSLVLYEQREDRARYHLLETVREYAQARLLKPRAAAAVRRRHLAFFLRLAREADSNFAGTQQAAWLDRLEIEHDNLRAALQLCQRDAVSPDCGARLATAMHMFWRVRGYLGEGRSWLDAAISRRRDAADVLQLRTLNAAGNVASRRNDYASANGYYQQALAIARELGDRRRTAGILTNLGLLAEEHEDLVGSRGFHEESMVVYEELGDRVGVAMVQLNLGVVAKLEQRYEEARHLFDECLAVFRRRGDKQRIAAALRNLGEAAYGRGAPEEAEAFLQESLEVIRELRDRKVTADTLLWLGVICQGRGAFEQSARLFAAAESMREAIQPPISWSDLAPYERSLEAVREHLDHETLERAWREGRAMTYEQAAACALQERATGDSSSVDSPPVP